MATEVRRAYLTRIGTVGFPGSHAVDLDANPHTDHVRIPVPVGPTSAQWIWDAVDGLCEDGDAAFVDDPPIAPVGLVIETNGGDA